MLKIHAHRYLAFGAEIGWLQKIIEAIEHKVELAISADAEVDPRKIIFSTAPKITQEQKNEEIKNTLELLSTLCEQINLPVSSSLAKKALERLPQTAGELDIIASAFVTELKSQLLLFIPKHRAKYFELTLPSGVSIKFPSASKELISAGNALVAGLYTAAIFHSMRAAEIGMRTLGATLEVSFPNKPLELAEWHNILDQADSKIVALKQLPAGTRKDEEIKFYSQAAIQFRYFKDAWRVRVAHARETYDEIPAIRVFDHTLEFFEVLSRRLTE